MYRVLPALLVLSGFTLLARATRRRPKGRRSTIAAVLSSKEAF